MNRFKTEQELLNYVRQFNSAFVLEYRDTDRNHFDVKHPVAGVAWNGQRLERNVEDEIRQEFVFQETKLEPLLLAVALR